MKITWTPRQRCANGGGDDEGDGCDSNEQVVNISMVVMGVIIVIWEVMRG